MGSLLFRLRQAVGRPAQETAAQEGDFALRELLRLRAYLCFRSNNWPWLLVKGVRASGVAEPDKASG